jgi:hypothetical protein
MSLLATYLQTQQAQAAEEERAALPPAFGTPKAPDPAAPFTTRSSHVRTAETCLRKWYLNEVCGLPDQETAAKTFGTITHLIYEEWFRDAKNPATSAHGEPAHREVARRSLHMYPAPGPGLLVEHKLSETLEDGTVYTGALDLADARPGAVVRLYDHKTCGSLKWAKTATDLEKDVSAVFYGRHLLRILHGLGFQEEALRSRWVYSERNPNGKTVPVNFILRPSNMRERWDKTLDMVKIMRRHAEQTPAWQDVTPNYDACGNYGGCRFQGQCNLVRRRQETMGLMDQLRASLPQQQAAQVQAAPQQAPAPIPAPVPAAPGGILAAFQQQQAAQPAAQAVAALPVQQPAQVQAPAVVLVSPGLEEGINVPVQVPPTFVAPIPAPVVGVVPPDAPAPDLTKDTVEKKTRKKREKAVDAVPMIATPQQAVQMVGPGTSMAEAVQDPRLFAILPPVQPIEKAPAQVQELAKAMAEAHNPAAIEIHYGGDSKQAEIITKIRKYAETSDASQDACLEMFILANKLERGEL